MRLDVDENCCFHCGLKNPSPAVVQSIEGVDREFCCLGCAAIASTISGAGLNDFYRQRTALQSTVSDVEAPASLDYTTLSRRLESGLDELDLLVDGLTCSACVWLCEKALLQQQGVQEASVRFDTAVCRIRFQSESVSANALAELLGRLGYQVKPYTFAAQEAQFKRNERALLSRVGVAGLAMMHVVVFSVAGHFGRQNGISPGIIELIERTALLLTISATLYCAWPFFSACRTALKQRALTMDVTLSLTVVLGVLLSAWHVVGGELAQNGKTYFESILMLLFFILLTRYIELRVRFANARNALRLNSSAASTVDKLSAKDVWTRCDIDTIQVGDTVRAHAGERLQVDGVVVDGCSEIDESAFNGEFTLQSRTPGDRVYAGSINSTALLTIRVTAVGETTQYAQILRMADAAQFSKPARVALADKMASQFLWLVLLCAALAAVAWLFIDSARVVDVVLATLIAACPCALSIATPTAFSVAMTRLRQAGVLVKEPNVFELLPEVGHLLFDKTGTLTEVSPTIARIDVVGSLTKDEVVAIACAMQRDSQHPMASAFQRLLERNEGKPSESSVSSLHALQLDECRQVMAAGVEACRQGRRYRLGSPEFVCHGLGVKDQGMRPPFAVQQGQIAIAMADDNELLTWFILDEGLRDDAHAVVTQLRARGLHVDIASGDLASRVERIGEMLGLPSSALHAQQSADQKWQLIRQWQSEGEVVMAVGDGANDSPALAAADVSVVMPVAAVAARAKASIVLLQPQLAKLLLLMRCGDKLQSVLRGSFRWSLLYNVLALALAVSGVLTPLLAAIGMSLSSLLVVLNALRVRQVFSPNANMMPGA